MRVGEHLDLDVARVLEVALEVDAVVGEELLALAGGALEGILEVVRGHRDAEALAAAAARRLAGDRVADLLGGLLRVPRRPERARSSPGRSGTPASCMISRALVFEPIASMAAAGGPMKTMSGFVERLAKAAFSARKP